MGPATDIAISRSRIEKEAQDTPQYYPTDEEQRLVSSIKRKYRDKDISKRAYEKTWFVNGAFIRGQHYITFNDFTRTFEIPYRVPPHRVRMVINYILAYVRRTKAKLTAHKPGYFVRPASNDQADVERARLAQKTLDSEWDRLNFFKKFKAGISWMLECGSVLFGITWDPFAGPVLLQDQPKVDPETGQPETNPETGEPLTEQVPVTDEHGRSLHSGEAQLEVISPYEIEIDPMATSMDDARWVMRNKIRSLAWVKEHYPEKGKYVKEEEVYILSFYEKRLRQLVGIFGYTTESQQGESDQESPKDSTVLHEYWEAPTEKHPDGQYVVVAGSVLLFQGPNPYKHKKFPYVKVDEITVPGRFWGMAIIEQAIPLQKNLNRARSQEIENRTLMGRPKILVPRTSKIRQSSFDAEAGEKIDYNPGPRGEKPELLYPQSTSNATVTEIQHTINDMQEILAWHEVSRGILPSANIPGVGIEKLQTADDTSMGDAATNIDNGLIEMGKLLLNICAQYWTEERMVRAGGEGARLEAMKLRGEDISGTDPSGDYHDVRVLPSSTLLKDPSTQREKVKELIEMQVLNPVDHQELILKLLDVGDIEQVFEDERLDEQWAQRENEMMEQATFSEPRDFENHEIHLRILDRYRKSERYRQLPDETKKLYDLHAEIHKQLMVEVAQRQAMQQAQVQQMLQPQPQPGEPVPSQNK